MYPGTKQKEDDAQYMMPDSNKRSKGKFDHKTNTTDKDWNVIIDTNNPTLQTTFKFRLILT